MIACTTLTSLKNIASGIGSAFDGITLTNGYPPTWLTILVDQHIRLVQFDLYTPLKIIISIFFANFFSFNICINENY